MSEAVERTMSCQSEERFLRAGDQAQERSFMKVGKKIVELAMSYVFVSVEEDGS